MPTTMEMTSTQSDQISQFLECHGTTPVPNSGTSEILKLVRSAKVVGSALSCESATKTFGVSQVSTGLWELVFAVISATSCTLHFDLHPSHQSHSRHISAPPATWFSPSPCTRSSALIWSSSSTTRSAPNPLRRKYTIRLIIRFASPTGCSLLQMRSGHLG